MGLLCFYLLCVDVDQIMMVRMIYRCKHNRPTHPKHKSDEMHTMTLNVSVDKNKQILSSSRVRQ